MERNSTGIFETTAGATNLHQLRARAQQGPTPRLELQLLTASFAFRLYMKTHTSNTRTQRPYRLDFIHLQAIFASFLQHGEIQGKQEETWSFWDWSESSSRARRYDLRLFSILPPGSIGVGLSISFGITEIFIVRIILVIALPRIHQRIRFYEQLSFHLCIWVAYE